MSAEEEHKQSEDTPITKKRQWRQHMMSFAKSRIVGDDANNRKSLPLYGNKSAITIKSNPEDVSEANRSPIQSSTNPVKKLYRSYSISLHNKQHTYLSKTPPPPQVQTQAQAQATISEQTQTKKPVVNRIDLAPAVNQSHIIPEDECGQNDTPRSSVKIKIDSARHTERKRTDVGGAAASVKNESPESSGDETCLYNTNGLTPDKQNKTSIAQPMTKLQKTLTVTSYHQYTIRPLVDSDYSPKLIAFLSKFNPNPEKKLTRQQLLTILFNRQADQHYTFIAISDETNNIMCLGSMILVSSIFCSEKNTAYIDELYVEPEYANTILSDKMLLRMLDCLECKPHVKTAIISVSGNLPVDVVKKCSKCEQMGRTYYVTLKK